MSLPAPMQELARRIVQREQALERAHRTLAHGVARALAQLDELLLDTPQGPHEQDTPQEPPGGPVLAPGPR